MSRVMARRLELRRFPPALLPLPALHQYPWASRLVRAPKSDREYGVDPLTDTCRHCMLPCCTSHITHGIHSTLIPHLVSQTATRTLPFAYHSIDQTMLIVPSFPLTLQNPSRFLLDARVHDLIVWRAIVAGTLAKAEAKCLSRDRAAGLKRSTSHRNRSATLELA